MEECRLTNLIRLIPSASNSSDTKEFKKISLILLFSHLGEDLLYTLFLSFTDSRGFKRNCIPKEDLDRFGKNKLEHIILPLFIKFYRQGNMKLVCSFFLAITIATFLFLSVLCEMAPTP